MNNNQHHSIAILGSGESGMGALRLAATLGIDAFISDSKVISAIAKNEIQALGFLYEEGKHSLDTLIQYKEVIKSPGIPETTAIILQLKEKGIPVVAEIEFAARYTDAHIIGITGSNGKTTTTLLTTHLLKSAGLDVASAGNVGHSLSDLLVHRLPQYIVLELSSFQLENVFDFKPNQAIILNITPDHLDRYDYSMDKYADAKMRMIQNLDKDSKLIFNHDDELILSKINGMKSPATHFPFSTHTKQSAFVVDGNILIVANGQSQLIAGDELALVGIHNQYNQMAAIVAALQVGVALPDILYGLSTFENAPHRMESIGQIDGVTYINDSKATNVDAVYYALEAIKTPIVWIAGGINKGNDYLKIETLVTKKVKVLICMGTDNQHLLDAFTNVAIIEVKSTAQAVSHAMEQSNPSDTVLLSPACASFDLFSSYEDRGNQFRKEVLKHLNEPIKV